MSNSAEWYDEPESANLGTPRPTFERPPKSIRTSRPPSSLSTKSHSSVHPLLGLHPLSATTTTTSPPIIITSHHFPSFQDPIDESDLSPIPIPQHASTLSRPRTTSTLSSPSSTAISSLAHIPTRPPSPYANFNHHSPTTTATTTPPNTTHLISFFPPAKPLFTLESVHPLLPAPFLSNHLTVLSKRAPIRESLERLKSTRTKTDGSHYGR